jgi:crotonobetainyl-CoA:carnitine CoA-transferase CaiB-like acyl-CoA transferase
VEVPERLAHIEEGVPPLAGVRVADFGIFVAGPYASKLLADYGAEVILVEPPSGRATLSGERTIIAANHGKDAIRIDAKSEGGRILIERLCARADIVLHNFRPGVAPRLGLDGETLRRYAPGLITLETTAYGPVGPRASLPGFDMVMQAHSGLEVRAGGEGNAPLCSRSPIVDFATGAIGAIGLLVCLYERLVTGRPISAETNLLNTSLHMMAELIRQPDGSFAGAPPLDRGQTGSRAAESLYQARDGWIALTILSEEMAEALGGVLGVVLPSSPDRWEESERAVIAAAVIGRDHADLLRALDAAGVWAELCQRDAWEVGCPDDGIMRRMTDPVYGEVTHCIGALVSFSRSITQPAGRLSTDPGADTAMILDRLGVTGEAAAALFEAGVVR